jgi:transcriptional regulator with XRE-family HTH domain
MLKEILKEKGISQAALAEELKLSPQVANLIVNGKQKLTEEIALKIAEILEVPVEDFFIENEDPSDEEASESKAEKKPVEKVEKKDNLYLVKNIGSNPIRILSYLIKSGEHLSLKKSEFDDIKVQRAIKLKLLAKA